MQIVNFKKNIVNFLSQMWWQSWEKGNESQFDFSWAQRVLYGRYNKTQTYIKAFKIKDFYIFFMFMY